jgi:hypothetical protein
MTPEELEMFAKSRDENLSLSWKNINCLPESIFELTYLSKTSINAGSKKYGHEKHPFFYWLR